MLIFLFSQKEKIILEFHISHQSNQLGKLNNPLTSFIYFISDDSRVDSGNTDHVSVSNQLPSTYHPL